MLGGKNATPLGYTIIEVMIFLAVSGVMFTIAAVFVNGKQAQVDFHNGVNSLDASVRDTVNDVQNGFYSVPSSGGATCHGFNGSQGTNSDCVFLGKGMDFDNTSVNIVGISGNRLDANGNSVTDLAAAAPQEITNATDTKNLATAPVAQVCSYPTSGGVSSNYGFAILSSLNQDSQAGSNGSAIGVNLYGYPAPYAAGGADTIVNTLNGGVALSKAVIYVDDGHRAATVTIKSDSNLTTAIDYIQRSLTGSYIC